MMALIETRTTEERASRTIRVAGLLVLAGSSLGTTLSVYALLNPWLFSVFIDISQYEAMPFFLGFYLPSFVIIIALGYVFATTRRLERMDLWHVAPLGILGLLCIVLSALSPFNILSFMGGFLALTAIIFAQAKPAFKTLWKREAAFLLEAGSLLVAASSSLFLLMWLINQFMPTYSPSFGTIGAFNLDSLLTTEALSFLIFFAIFRFGFRSALTSLCGMLGLVSTATFSLIAIENRFFYANASAFLGAFLAGTGIVFVFGGALIYFKLFLYKATSPVVLMPSFVFRGKYCPYCGEPWTDQARTVCSSCGHSLKWRPEVPFCPYCGRLISKGIQTCPHCKEDVASRPIIYSLAKLEKKEIWGLERESSIEKALRVMSEHIPLTLKEYVYVVLLSFSFAFILFVSYVRTEPHPQYVGRYFLVHYGFPFEWLEITTSISAGASARFLLDALILDGILYFWLAFGIILGLAKFFERIRG
jgi:hypothetical protein